MDKPNRAIFEILTMIMGIEINPTKYLINKREFKRDWQGRHVRHPKWLTTH